MNVKFVKMHGAGNDFVMIDDRAGTFPDDWRKLAALATRGTGVGCEGVNLRVGTAPEVWMITLRRAGEES